MTSRRAAWSDFHRDLSREYRAFDFRRSGGAYIYGTAEREAIGVASYQIDPRFGGDCIRFCVNLEVFVLALVDEARRAMPAATMIKWENSHWSERLTLEPGEGDHWWELDTANPGSAQLVRAWHVASVASTVAPKILEMADERVMLEYWSAGGYGGLGRFERDRNFEKLMEFRQKRGDSSKEL